MRDIRIPGGTDTQPFRAPMMRMGRSQFDLSHNHKTTFDAGNLIPYFCAEVIPGDTQTCKLQSIVRIFSPLDAPIMDNIHVDLHFFFVPNRIVWNNWDAFLGAHDGAGAQDVDFTIPILQAGQVVAASDLRNYLGLPIGLNTTTTEVSALPFRAIRAIYNEWFRDQNLIGEITVPLDDGPDGGTGVLRSAKKPDYFTSALPYLQKGDPVTINLGGNAEVNIAPGTAAAQNVTIVHGPGDYRLLDSNLANVDLSATAGPAANVLYADLSSATGITINALREAAAIQRLLEREARSGTRIPEIIRGAFGVDVPDYRTQRPEYLGGGYGYINVSPVANTSGTATEDQAQLAGVGVGTLRASFAKSFVEHGHVIGILRARGEISYQQGLDRMWSRSTKYDFLWPELVHLGEQAILNKELWIEGDSTDEDVFGYTERFAEYRFKKSLVTGKFASDAPGSLDFWHLSEDFASQPALNATFIEDATPMSRVTTVDTEPDFIIDGRFTYKVARALPVRPTPSLAPARF